MAFAEFETQPLEGFLRDHTDPSALWIFLHVPKTAGSSFGREISQELAPYSNIHVDYEDRERSYDEQLRLAVDRFLAKEVEAPHRSASGHMPYRLLDKVVAAVPHAKVVTILRDPVARVISDYRYQRTPAHPPYQEFIAKFPSVESYIRAPESQNKMFRFLAPEGAAEDFESAYAAITGKLTFIGLLEMYPLSFNVLFRLFGVGDRTPVEHQRKTQVTDHNKVEVTPQLVAELRDLNQLDVELFNRVRATLVSRREAWVDLRRRGRAAPSRA